MKAHIAGKDSRITKAKEPGQVSMEAIAMKQHNATGGSSINAAHGDLANKEFFSVAVYPELTMPVPGRSLCCKIGMTSGISLSRQA